MKIKAWRTQGSAMKIAKKTLKKILTQIGSKLSRAGKAKILVSIKVRERL